MIRSLRTLGAATIWMMAGRASGLVWRVLLIASLGYADYGLYASAYALSTILIAPIENIFVVRSVRVNDDSFTGERSLRALIGGVLVLGGAVVYAFNFLLGFALIVAGAEMAFNAFKSIAVREGRPSYVMRVDAVRQISSIAISAAYLGWAGSAATLESASLWYLAPYLVVAVLTVRVCVGHRPRARAPWRAHALLMIDALVLAVYTQGDILLLQALGSDEAVGAYSLASQLALTASLVGYMYGQQFAASLREGGAGPSPRGTLLLAVLTGAGALGLGALLCTFPEWRPVGVVLMIIAPFAALRSISNSWVTPLYIASLDARRVVWNVVALVVRMGFLLLSLIGFGAGAAQSAAVAAVVGETVLVAGFWWILRTSPRDGGTVSALG